jgi:hypothetical protein
MVGARGAPTEKPDPRAHRSTRTRVAVCCPDGRTGCCAHSRSDRGRTDPGVASRLLRRCARLLKRPLPAHRVIHPELVEALAVTGEHHHARACGHGDASRQQQPRCKRKEVCSSHNRSPLRVWLLRPRRDLDPSLAACLYVGIVGLAARTVVPVAVARLGRGSPFLLYVHRRALDHSRRRGIDVVRRVVPVRIGPSPPPRPDDDATVEPRTAPVPARVATIPTARVATIPTARTTRPMAMAARPVAAIGVSTAVPASGQRGYRSECKQATNQDQDHQRTFHGTSRGGAQVLKPSGVPLRFRGNRSITSVV